jgi:hypothetical protein
LTSCPLDISSIEIEGDYRCSKWISHAVLFSLEELQQLLHVVAPCFFVPIAEPVAKENWSIPLEAIFEKYKEYIEGVNNAADLPSPQLRRFFSLGLTCCLTDLYAVPLSQDRIFIKPKRPIIQIQLYRCYLSPEKEFHPMILHPSSFSWGLQFSYPQIYEDPKTHEFSKVLQEESFANTKLYKTIVSWIREHTKPWTVVIEGKKIAAPFRLGREAEDPLSYHLGLKKALLYLAQSS